MKFLLWMPMVWGLLSGAIAAPRYFQYDGYTRLVLDLPKSVAYQVEAHPGGLKVVLKDLKLKVESGQINTRQIKSYSLQPNSSGGMQWDLQAVAKLPYTVFLLANDDHTVRLVIDYGVGSSGARDSKPPPVVQPDIKKPAPQQKLRVVIDPGHGGRFPGMKGYILEKDVTLDVGLRVKALLEDKGLEVLMTRVSDTQLASDLETDLTLRAKMANAGTVHAFVSIHVNSGPATAQGIETYVFGKPLEKSTRSLAVLENGGGVLGESITKKAETLAQNLIGDLIAQSNLALSRVLADKVQKHLVQDTLSVNRGVKRDYFAVIRLARTPAILTEIGFGSHPTEGPKLGTPEYRQQIAQSIALGISEFLNIK